MKTDLSTYDEKELLLRLSAGDEQAFRKLYELYWNNVYTIALHYFRSPLVAQDAVQEVFLKLWVKRQQLSGVNNFGAYLNRIARNQVIDLLRKKVLESAPLPAETKDAEHIIPQQQLETKEIANYIRMAVDQLTSQQRLVWQLSREQGLPLKEVANQLSISYSTAREHMSQALKTIRSFLKENLGHLYILALLFLDF